MRLEDLIVRLRIEDDNHDSEGKKKQTGGNSMGQETRKKRSIKPREFKEK